MIFNITHMTKSTNGLYSFWTGEPSVLKNGGSIMYLANADAEQIVFDLHNFTQLFPNLAIIGEHGIKRVRRTETEYGYILEEVL